MGLLCGVSTAVEFGTQVRQLFHLTPIPNNKVTFRIAFSVNLATISSDLVPLVQDRNAEILTRNLEEDAPIWRHKRYLTQPALCDGDEPYALLRRWTERFFESDVNVPDVPANHDDGVYGLYAERTAPPESESDSQAGGTIQRLTKETVRAIIFEHMPSVFNAVAVDHPFVVQYEIGGEHGGDYFIEIEQESCRPGEGQHHSPTLRVTIEDRDWVDLNHGDLDGAQAFLTNRLRVEGDLSLAMKLAEAFPIEAGRANDPQPRTLAP
jgi:putative sterol carrier protein